MDEKLIEFCKYIASTKNYFTSSCCSGRIILLRIEGNGRDKRNCHFHKKWHDVVPFGELWNGIIEGTKGKIWFKLEPFYLAHWVQKSGICKKILEVMKLSGVKRRDNCSKRGQIYCRIHGHPRDIFLS